MDLMPRFKRPRLFHEVDEDEIYVIENTVLFTVPIAAEGLQANVGWDADIGSYFFIVLRTSVDHLNGAYDHDLGKPVEVGDIYWAGGRWSHAPIEAEPDMREPIQTVTELIRLTWDEFDWPDADYETLLRLRDAPAHQALSMIMVDDDLEVRRDMSDWMVSDFFGFARKAGRTSGYWTNHARLSPGPRKHL